MSFIHKRIDVLKKDESAIEMEIASEAGLDPDLIIVHKESEEGGLRSYRTFGRVTESGDVPIMYIDQEHILWLPSHYI